jgi:hypothetical protein
MWVAALLALYHAAAYLILHYIGFTMPGGWIVFGLSYITIVLSTYAGMMLGLFASALAPNANSVPLILILLMVPQIVLAGALVPLPETVTSAISARWAFEALMGISGPGSDVAADPCWDLPEEEREALANEDKAARGCRCMGAQVFNRYSCEFPGLGQFYDPAIDEPEPVEPAEVGDPPEKPVLPEQPVEPANKNDSQAMAVYMEELKDYQNTADQIQSDYQNEVDAYQELVDQYQEDLIDYQEEYADWEINRNAAISKAEGTIDRYQERYGWTNVNKEDTPAFWEKVGKAWLAQGLIITVLFFLILLSMKRKDKAA